MNRENSEISASFKTDVPKLIVKAIFPNKEAKNRENVLFEVEWNLRYDSTQPKNSKFPYKEIKKSCPVLLNEFFEKEFFRNNEIYSKSIS